MENQDKIEQVIPEVDRNLLEAELTEDKFVRNTNNGNNKIYMVTWHNAPNVTTEIGRLREITFREAGGGTGKSCDLDEFDTEEDPFLQLLVWNPADREIVGGYRFKRMEKMNFSSRGVLDSPTAELFNLTERFHKEIRPYSIELGRSYVQPNYQPYLNFRKGMYSLDNIWDGLGAIIAENPDIRYFFGKLTMYPHYNTFARDLILFFMRKHFPDRFCLAYPFEPLRMQTDKEIMENIFQGKSYDEDFKTLQHCVRSVGENIPPLVNAYMSLSSTMRTFGTALNPGFGNVEETGILITIGDIFEVKKDRHISTYRKTES